MITAILDMFVLLILLAFGTRVVRALFIAALEPQRIRHDRQV